MDSDDWFSWHNAFWHVLTQLAASGRESLCLGRSASCSLQLERFSHFSLTNLKLIPVALALPEKLKAKNLFLDLLN